MSRWTWIILLVVVAAFVVILVYLMTLPAPVDPDVTAPPPAAPATQ